MNRLSYDKLLKIMQHGNSGNLNRVNVTKWKHLESRVNAFRCCFESNESN